MTEIILGSDGYIGGRLGAHLPDAIKTTRIGSYLDVAASPDGPSE